MSSSKTNLPDTELCNAAIAYARTVSEPFSVENGLLTASLKVKRRVVEDRHAELIEDMYKAASAA